MHCPRCDFGNPEGMSFCGKCGAPLTPRCAQCNFENPAGFAFCGKCGSPLVGQSSVQSLESGVQKTSDFGPRTSDTGTQTLDPRLNDSRLTAAERRQLTVMFIDLVDSTRLSQQLDPEDYHARVQAYQSVCSQVIAHYEGYIAQYLGDGVLVYFGYPTAHEDDAVRAVRSGLEIVVAVSQLQLTPPLHIRVGLHTGPVVVAEIGTGVQTEQLALGETPNFAARIQGTANSDEVMISAATHRLVEGLFDCEERGQPTLKGVATPLTLYRVLREGEAHSRFQVVARKGLTPLVGREHEFGLLRERWERVRDGEGQVVLLSGEPGIGKSRLVEALKDSLKHEGVSCLELRCSPYHQNSALYPVLEHLQRVLQFQQTDSSEQKLKKLEQALSRACQDLQETVPLLASLLSLPAAAYPLPAFSPQKQKEKTYEALVTWLCTEAQQQAVTYAWEDLHWADPSTLELLTLFVEQVPTTRVLVVLTFRPEFTPPWGSHSYLSQILLSRLSRTQVGLMVEKVTGGKTLPAEVVQQIVSKTDGVPLFVEEIIKTVLESVESRESIESEKKVAQPSLQLGIPATLQDALMARLDRLGAAKEIAQVGATIGREFHYDLLQAVSPLTEDTLQQGLRQLVEAELVYQSGRPPQATYFFKHALIQDTAYQSLLKSRRQQLHQQVAHVLVKQFPQTIETQPELAAHHYTEARSIEQAIPYWQQASELASKRVAFKEAIAHLDQGMALVSMLPPSAERDGIELDLRIPLGTAWIALKAWGAPETWTSLHPALELAKSLRRHEALLPIYYGLWNSVLVQGRITESLDWVNDMLATAEASGDADLLLMAHTAACVTHYFRGDLGQSREHNDKVMALYDETQHRHLADLMNRDPKTSVGIFISAGTWMLGYPDHAVQVSDANDAHARRRGHPFDLGFALIVGSYVWDYRCEPKQMLARVEEAEGLGRVHSLPFISDVLAQVWKGVAWLRIGRLAEGIPQLRDALEAFNAHGAELGMPYYRAVLAEGLVLSGDLVGGLQLIETNLRQIARPGWEERLHLAEVLRLKGWMLTLQGDLEGAEQNYLVSLDWARQQQAKSWELRTATSLARLWQQQGKCTEAHQMLSDIYNWFTEGFDTKDLQESKALIAELNH